MTMHVQHTLLQVVLCATEVMLIQLLTLQSSQVHYRCSSTIAEFRAACTQKCKHSMAAWASIVLSQIWDSMKILAITIACDVWRVCGSNLASG